MKNISSPPSCNSAVDWICSHSFETKHWYIPGSSFCTFLIISLGGSVNICKKKMEGIYIYKLYYNYVSTIMHQCLINCDAGFFNLVNSMKFGILFNNIIWSLQPLWFLKCLILPQLDCRAILACRRATNSHHEPDVRTQYTEIVRLYQHQLFVPEVADEL